jgi:hypothetical protein
MLSESDYKTQLGLYLRLVVGLGGYSRLVNVATMFAFVPRGHACINVMLAIRVPGLETAPADVSLVRL